MKPNRYSLAALALVVASALVGAWAYGRLPPDAVIAIHFGADGQANGFAPKAKGLFMGPVMGLGLVLLMAVLPRVSRQREALERAAGPYGLAMIGGAAILLLAQISIVARAMDARIDVLRMIFPAIGVLFAVLGNLLGKVRRNEFFGVRTPWTLMDPTVWDRTQRFTGRLMVLGGVIMVITGISIPDKRLLVPILLACALAPALAGVVYSWAIFRGPAKG